MNTQIKLQYVSKMAIKVIKLLRAILGHTDKWPLKALLLDTSKYQKNNGLGHLIGTSKAFNKLFTFT